MWPGTANSGGWRSPQASAGTPNNTREPARSGKKKPQPRTVGVDLAKKMDSRYFCTVNPKEGVMSKRFSEQFKQEAVQLVSAERPIRQVASYLGIGYSTLDKWVRAHRERTGQLVALTQEQKRIRELERQVAHLQEVNDILKKATVYFANPANR